MHRFITSDRFTETQESPSQEEIQETICTIGGLIRELWREYGSFRERFTEFLGEFSELSEEHEVQLEAAAEEHMLWLENLTRSFDAQLTVLEKGLCRVEEPDG